MYICITFGRPYSQTYSSSYRGCSLRLQYMRYFKMIAFSTTRTNLLSRVRVGVAVPMTIHSLFSLLSLLQEQCYVTVHE